MSIETKQNTDINNPEDINIKYLLAGKRLFVVYCFSIDIYPLRGIII